MIKDFVPARTSLASGIVIKQHILERNRYKTPTVNQNTTIAKFVDSSNIYNQSLSFQNIAISGTIKPQWNNYNNGKISNTTGGPGGSVNTFNSINTTPYGPNGVGPENIFNITQSWDENYPTLSGSALHIQNTQDEFYNGEFSGSQVTVTTQNLNPGCDPFKKVSNTGINYTGIRIYSGSQYNFGDYIDINNNPINGYISIWYQQADDPTLTPGPIPGPR